MASSQTSLLQLPIFASGDVPKWNTDWNSAMNKLNDNSIMMLKFNSDNITYKKPTESFTENTYKISIGTLTVSSFKDVLLGNIKADVQTNIGSISDDVLTVNSGLFRTIYNESLPSGNFILRDAGRDETNVYVTTDGSVFGVFKDFVNDSTTLVGKINITGEISRDIYTRSNLHLDFQMWGSINGFATTSPDQSWDYWESLGFSDSSSYSQLTSQIQSIFDDFAMNIMQKAILILNPKYCSFVES